MQLVPGFVRHDVPHRHADVSGLGEQRQVADEVQQLMSRRFVGKKHGRVPERVPVRDQSAVLGPPSDVPRAEVRHDIRHRGEGARARQDVGEAPVLGGRPALPLLADGAALVREVDAVRQLRHAVWVERHERVALPHRHRFVQAPSEAIAFGGPVLRATRRRAHNPDARGVVAKRVRRAVQDGKLTRALHLDARVVDAQSFERREQVFRRADGFHPVLGVAETRRESQRRLRIRDARRDAPFAGDAERVRGLRSFLALPP